jgi:hypothetical protein
MPAGKLRFIDRARVHSFLDTKLNLRRTSIARSPSRRSRGNSHWLISAVRTGIPLGQRTHNLQRRLTGSCNHSNKPVIHG